MSIEILFLEFLYENPSDAEKLSSRFSVGLQESQKILADLFDNSFVYKNDKGLFASTPAGMAFVKQELDRLSVNDLPRSVSPDTPYPLFVRSITADKKAIMGIYDKRGGRLDIYPVLPDAACNSGFAAAIIEAHLFNSVNYLKSIKIYDETKRRIFKPKDGSVKLSAAKRELEFLCATLELVLGKCDIGDYLSLLLEMRHSLVSVMGGFGVALNECYVLEKYFKDSDFSQKKQDLFADLYEKCGKVKRAFDSSKGLSKISLMLSCDVFTLC